MRVTEGAAAARGAAAKASGDPHGTPSATKGPSSTGRRGALALGLLCAAQFMVVLDISIVNVALPSMQRELGMSSAALQGVVTAYALTFGGFLLLGGRAADLYGRRRLLVASLLLFAAASLAGGLAQSGVQLVAARAVQGLAGAVVAPAVLSLLTTAFAEGSARNRALGVFGTVGASGFAAGVLAGGLLTQLLGWRWVMFVNVPIALAVAALAPWLLKESEGARRRLDVPGALTITTGTALLVFGVSQAEGAGWASAQTIGYLVAAAALIAGFVVLESRTRDPLVRLGIFASRSLSGADMVALLQGASLAPTLYIITLYLQGTLEYSPVLTGLTFLPQALVVAFAAPLVARLTSRTGVLPGLVAGTTALAAGLLVLSRITVLGDPWTAVAPGLLLLGIGVAFVNVNVSIAATAGIADDEQGLASGLYNTAQQVGTALGLAVVVAVLTTTTGDGAQGQVDGYRAALLTTTAFAAGALAVTLLAVRGSAAT